MENSKLGFIGAGHMASAIVRILLDKNLIPPENILMFDPDEARLAPHTARGVRAAASNRALAEESLLIILAVKPQVMETVLAEVAPVSAEKNFLSIAAGLSTHYLRARLDPSAHVVRVMPNTPLSLGFGATVIARSEDLPKELLHTAQDLFSAAGVVTVLDEDKLNEVIGVSSTSPAFFFRMAGVMRRAAEAQGIDPDTALTLIARTMEGSAQMLLTGRAPETLVSEVASPGGTTRAALAVLDDSDFDDALHRAMLRCTERAYELSQ
ncbi:MAG: pyrroline-5-carboxylate reductase [Oscillospiraceae bacterium]|nr:pyrroline-5-carboxylate reductase [Oscillospiraceae bacterium]